jgi:hypothetical protein
LTLPEQGAGELGHHQRLGLGAALGVLCSSESEDIACVLDQYMLEAASGADERHAALASEANGA